MSNNNKKLKGGIIGIGRMGLTHLSILNNYENVEIIGMVDNNKTILDILSKYLTMNFYNNSKIMFDDLKLDFVIIATPPGFHYSDIKKALENNVNVFVEKPFVMEINDGQELISLAKRKNLVNQVGYVVRYNESFSKVKYLLENKIIGKIISFRSEMFGATVQNSSNKSWRDNSKIGGGCINEFASHAIDLIIHYFGEPKKIVGSTIQKVFSKNTDDIINSTFIYDDNLIGTISANWCDASYRKPTNKLIIFGTNGSIVTDKYSVKVFLKKSNLKIGLKNGWNTSYITDIFEPVNYYVRGNEYSRQLDSFINSLKDNNKFIGPSFDEAFQVDKVINNIIENSKM